MATIELINSNGKIIQSIENINAIEENEFEYRTDIVKVIINGHLQYIDDSAFYGCTHLQSISIPEGVTSIGYFTFSDCTGLQSINISEGVTSIGSYAFNNCTGLQSINIPEGVTSIGGCAFSGCTGLQSINIPEGVTSIGVGAFLKCTGLQSINIPEGVTSIGVGAFSGCTGLTQIKITTTDQSELERIKNLLPKTLQDKVIPVDLKKISEIKNKALLQLLYHPLATSLGTANLGDTKESPVGKLPLEMITSINRFIIKNTLVYRKMQQALDAVIIPVSEDGTPDLSAYEEKCNEIIDNKITSLNNMLPSRFFSHQKNTAQQKQEEPDITDLRPGFE